MTAAIADLIARYDGRAPRYTSYPTAPHFTGGVGEQAYAQWLAALPDDAPLSLYLHVPFCDRLCFYCRCNTGVVRLESSHRAYAGRLIAEIESVAEVIGRRLPARLARAARSLGVHSLNLDLNYGLPLQTVESVTRTARRALDLNADRAAVFGYAHVPWMKKNQAAIDEKALPGAYERYAQYQAIHRVLTQEGGYVAIGFDHYAKAGKAMAVAEWDGGPRHSRAI